MLVSVRGRLLRPWAIIPNRTHYDLFFAPELVPTVRPFLNGRDQVKSWDDVVEGR